MRKKKGLHKKKIKLLQLINKQYMPEKILSDEHLKLKMCILIN
jgi:hypothetical protein